MAQPVVSGARATAATQGIDQNSRVIDMSDSIYLLDPNMAPLTAITMKIRKSHAINPKIEWLEDDYIPSQTTASGAVGTSATVDVAAGTGVYFRPGDVLQHVSSGENMYVTAVAGDALTVVRDIKNPGAASPATIADGDMLLVVGSASQEGALSREVKTTQKTPQHNFTQIFRWPWSSTGTLQASELYGGSDMNYQGKKAGLEHRIQVERAYLFGEKAEDLESGNIGDGQTPLRFCEGVIPRVTTNVTTVSGGSLTRDVMETFLRTGFRYGPARKMLFASRLLVSLLNSIASTSIETIPTTNSFPLALTEYVSGHGKLYICTHNLLEGAEGATYNYDGWGLLLDLDSIFYRYLQGRDTKIRTNIHANDEDATRHEYLTECCPMVIQEQNHSIMKNAQTHA